MAKASFSSLKKYPAKDAKKLILELSSLYGVDLSNLLTYSFYINSRGKINISTQDFLNMDFARINSVGIYFGTISDHGTFRPSIEGSQIIKPKQNIVKLDDKGFQSYITGESLFLDEVEFVNKTEEGTFFIVKYKGNFIGSVSLREKELLNYISKGRRIDFNKVF